MRRRVITHALVAAALLIAAPAPAAAAPRGAETIPGQYIVVYRATVADPSTETDRHERSKGFRSRLRYSRSVKGFAARLSPGQVRQLREDPHVRLVAPDRRVKALGWVSLAAGERIPTGVRRIEAGATGFARQASTANVAVLDTGVDLAHPDLNVTDGKNCIGSGPAQDDHGHGTHVAGTIGARNSGSGVVGIAPGTKLRAVKVLNSAGEGDWSNLICGVDWVTATRTDADPANDVAVANLSLGGPGDPVADCATTADPLHLAICASSAAGVVYAVAAGNDAWDYDYAPSPDLPAAYPEVLTVTAIADSDGKGGGTGAAPACRTGETDDTHAKFSNFAATAAAQAHTIAGPGVCIESTTRGGGYGTSSGTSMATPHVAGLAALCLGEAGPPATAPCAGLTSAQVIAKLIAEGDARTRRISTYGFAGDPLRPVSGVYFGFLGHANDVVAPTISTLSPAASATGVSTAASVAVTFSEPMDTASAQAAFSLVPTAGGPALPGTFTWTANKLTFKSTAALAEGTSYTATVSTAARDASGNPMAAAKSWALQTWTLVRAYPSSTSLESGTLRAGDASRLAADDNAYYEVDSTTTGTRTTGWYASTSGVTNALKSLTITYKGRNSISCSQNVAVWRWTTSTWVSLDTRNVSTTEVSIAKSPTGTLADYVSGTTGDGEVRVRVRCTHASTSFYASADLLRVGFARP